MKKSLNKLKNGLFVVLNLARKRSEESVGCPWIARCCFNLVEVLQQFKESIEKTCVDGGRYLACDRGKVSNKKKLMSLRLEARYIDK